VLLLLQGTLLLQVEPVQPEQHHLRLLEELAESAGVLSSLLPSKSLDQEQFWLKGKMQMLEQIAQQEVRVVLLLTKH
jgi:hypothetical protein